MNTLSVQENKIECNENLINTKLFNKQFIAASLIALTFFFADYLLSTTIPLYTLEIGGNASTAGTFVSVIAFTALFLRPLLGNLLDRKSRKLVLILGTIALTSVSFFYGLANSIPLILIFAVIHGLAVSAITTSAPTIVADVTPSSRLPQGMSLYGITMTATLAAGPVAALYLISEFSYSLTLNIALCLSLLSIALTFLINYEKKAKAFSRNTVVTKKKLTIKTLFEKTALIPSLYQIFLAFGISTLVTFIPIYGESRGIDNIGLFFTVYAVSGVVISSVTGQLVQKYGIRKVFIPSLVLQFIAFLLLAFAGSLPLILVAAFLYGFGATASLALISIIGMEAASPDRRGAANSTLFAAMDIGMALGSLILGFISTQFGFTVTFIITAFIILIDIMIFLILNKESPGFSPVEDASPFTT